MAVREPKTRTNTSIDIVGRDAKKKGSLELTPGNLIYSRLNGPETLRLTYQQLIDLLEKEVAYQAVDQLKPMPRGRSDGDDFTLNCWESEEQWLSFGNDKGLSSGDATGLWATSPLKNMGPNRQNEGGYDIDSGIAKGKKSKRRSWQARISVQAVLTILDHYINNELVDATDRTPLGKDVVVTRPQMRTILLRLLKKVGY